MVLVNRDLVTANKTIESRRYKIVTGPLKSELWNATLQWKPKHGEGLRYELVLLSLRGGWKHLTDQKGLVFRLRRMLMLLQGREVDKGTPEKHERDDNNQRNARPVNNGKGSRCALLLRAVNWVLSGKPITRQGIGKDCGRAIIGYTAIISVYLPQNLTVGDFDTRQTEFKKSLLDIPKYSFIISDINTRSPKW